MPTFDEDLTNDTQISNFCYLPLYSAYVGTDVTDLRLALYIANNPRTTVKISL